MRQKCELDVDTIKCPLCTNPLSPPIYQCQNGHMACGACCEKLQGEGCPYCRSTPFAHSRCLALEKIVKSLLISCKYAPEGCTELVKLTKKEEHEISFCEYRPIQCPLLLCHHTTPKRGILEHLRRLHNVSSGEIVELDPVSRTVKFKMSRTMRLPFVLVTAAEELQFLIHASLSQCHSRLPKSAIRSMAILAAGDVFCCTSFGSNFMMYNLKVKASGGSSFFTMETSAVDNHGCNNIRRNCQFLILPSSHLRTDQQDFDLELRLL